MNASKGKIKALGFLWGIFPWLIVACIVALMYNLWGRIGDEKARLQEARKEAMHKEIPAARVITLTLKTARLEDKINLPAEVEPAEEVLVKAEVPGQVTGILVKEGQRIQRGQALVVLDDRDYRSRLARIEANYRLAEIEYDRNAALIRMNATSRSKLDSIEAQLKDLEAQRREARLALDRTRITSPISCVLNEIKAEKGYFVGVGDPVAQVIQVDQVKVTVGVPESDVAPIFDLQEADVLIEALDNLRVKGRKIFLSRKPKTLARLYDLELEVPNPDGRVLPGMFARVELVKGVFEDALTVPLYSVITQGEERFVYLEEDGKASKRRVETGILAGWRIQILSGLKAGDRVIVVGHRMVDEGQPLEVIKNVDDPREILKP